MTRLRLLALALVASVAPMLSTLLAPSDVGAWANSSPPTQGCSALAGRTFWDEDSSGYNTFLEEMAVLGFNADDPTHSLVMLNASSPNSNPFVIYWEKLANSQMTLDFDTATTSKLIRAPAQANLAYAYQPAGDRWYLDTTTPPQNLPTQQNITTVACIHKAVNLNYGQNYSGISYSSQQDDPTGQDCSGFDVACYISGVFSNIGNTFAAVGSAIVNAIAGLFIPSGDIMLALFNDIKTVFTNKLGFLIYPLTFFVNAFNTMATASSCAPDCSFNAGTIFGGQLTISPLVLQQYIPTYYNLVLNVFRASTVLSLMLALNKKYLSIVKA